MIKLKTAFQSTDETTLAAFESQLAVRLPEDYREFLLMCNGGQPIDSRFMVEGWGATEVHILYGLNTGRTACDLEWASSLFEKFFPDSVIPIGCDPEGYVICLGVRRAAFGKVYFWHRGERLEQFVQIASSFDSFLSILGPNQ
jgi:hypothetical protein